MLRPSRISGETTANMCFFFFFLTFHSIRNNLQLKEQFAILGNTVFTFQHRLQRRSVQLPGLYGNHEACSPKCQNYSLILTNYKLSVKYWQLPLANSKNIRPKGDSQESHCYKCSSNFNRCLRASSPLGQDAWWSRLVCE